MTIARLLVALAAMLLVAAIFFSAITLINHNSILNCQDKLLTQALNEAFHHQPLRLPPPCA